MRENLYNITGFTPENFSLRTTIDEFNAKFGETYLKVNDKLEHVSEIDWDDKESKLYLRIIEQKALKYEHEIKTIKSFKPKVGCYFTSKGNLIIFSKTARRMYKKSLCLGENYTMSVINLNSKKRIADINITPEIQSLTDSRNIPGIGYISNNRQIVFSKNDILFLGTKIGNYIMHNTRLISFNVFPLWQQEIKDIITYELEV